MVLEPKKLDFSKWGAFMARFAIISTQLKQILKNLVACMETSGNWNEASKAHLEHSRTRTSALNLWRVTRLGVAGTLQVATLCVDVIF